MKKHLAYIAALALAGCSTAPIYPHPAMIEEMKALAGPSVEVKTDFYQSGQKRHSAIQVVRAGQPAEFEEPGPAPYSVVATPYVLDGGQIVVDVKAKWQLIKVLNTNKLYREFNNNYATIYGESGKPATPIDFKIDGIPVSLVITSTKMN